MELGSFFHFSNRFFLQFMDSKNLLTSLLRRLGDGLKREKYPRLPIFFFRYAKQSCVVLAFLLNEVAIQMKDGKV